ncbi:MAG: tetratricopeptide repeat protein [Vicinamibacteria bacterium]
MSFLLALALATAVSAPVQAAPAESFDALAARAKAAFAASRDAEALDAYKAALALKPDWDEGLWYVATILYQSGRRAEADAAYGRFLAVKPQVGAGWVLRGFCAFETGDYKGAASLLHRGLGLGLGGNKELDTLGRLRLAMSLVKTFEFELALQPLTVLSRSAAEDPRVLDTAGLAILRTAMLPEEIPADRKDLVRRAGRAAVLHFADRSTEAEKAYAEVVEAYPKEPWIRYAQGVFYLRTDSERAVEALRGELEVNPTNVHACLDIAFELLKLQRFDEAQGAAERAVLMAPSLFASHVALGRALVEKGDLERGIGELQRALLLAPEAPEVHFALARAYAKAGREEDAAKERAEFARLEQARAAAGGSTAAPAEPRP